MPGEDILCLFVVYMITGSIFLAVVIDRMLKLWVSFEPQSKYQMDLL